MISTEHVISETPFVIRRRVKWGECDPAGVVYTATFGEYVISAAELFYGRLLNGTPQALKNHHSFGTPTRALAFDFKASLWPDDEFDMAVLVDRIGEHTYTLLIQGTVRGASAFDARLTPICVARSERRAIPVPPIMRDALTAYQTACAHAASSRSGDQ